MFIHLNKKKRDILGPGDVGYLTAAIKEINTVRVGDTITHKHHKAKQALAGYREMNSVVFCGLYPIDSAKYNDLKDALERLKLNDASLKFEPETSQALGFGFRNWFFRVASYGNYSGKNIKGIWH